MRKNNSGLLILIPAGVITLAALGLLTYDLILSLVKYMPSRGLFGSSMVGLRYYEQLFTSPQFGSIIGNSFLHTLATLALTLPGGVLFSLLLGLIPNRPVKAALAAVALLVALLPETMWVNGAQSLLKRFSEAMKAAGFEPGSLSYSFWPAYLLSIIVPKTAMCVFAGLTLNLSNGSNGVKGALLAGLVPALLMLLPDMHTTYMVQNSMNMRQSDTLTTYIYKMGLANMQFSIASATTVIGKIGSCIIGAAPALLIGLFACRSARFGKVRGSGWVFEGLGALLGGLVTAAAAILICVIGKELLTMDGISIFMTNTVVLGLLAALFAFALLAGILFLSRKADGRFLCVLGFAVMALALTQMRVFVLGKYLSARDMGLINTHLPAALEALCHPAFVTLVIVLAATRPLTVRQTLMTAGGGALAAGMIAAGDWFGSMIYFHDRNRYPLSLYLRMLMQNPYMIPLDPETQAASIQGLISGSMLLMVLLCLAFGIIAVTVLMMGVGGSRACRVNPRPYGD